MNGVLRCTVLAVSAVVLAGTAQSVSAQAYSSKAARFVVPGPLPIALAPGSENREPLPLAPRRGEPTNVVLQELGYNSSEIDSLEAIGAVKQG